jgi:hypothetical protein
MLRQAGQDSASSRLHSRAQLLCILCAGSANRGQPILRQRRRRRCGGADNEQQRQTSHSKPRLKMPIKKSRSA